MAPRKADAAFAIEYLQEHPEGGLCCQDGDWWVTPNANDTDLRSLLLDSTEAEQLTEDARLRPVSGISHPGRLLWVVRRMT